MKKFPTSEKEWQAESDARTLAEYQKIMGDKDRMSRALKIAKREAARYREQADAMDKVVGSRPRRKK